MSYIIIINKDTRTYTYITYIHTYIQRSVVIVCSLSHVQVFCDPVDYRLPGSSVHGISQTRIQEWVAISFSGRSSRLRDWIYVSCTGRQILYHWMTREAHNEILLDHKKEQNNTICSNMDKPRDYCMKGTKLDRERKIPNAVIYMWSLNYDTVELFMKQKQTQTHKIRFWLPKGREVWGGINYEFCISRYKILYIK